MGLPKLTKMGVTTFFGFSLIGFSLRLLEERIEFLQNVKTEPSFLPAAFSSAPRGCKMKRTLPLKCRRLGSKRAYLSLMPLRLTLSYRDSSCVDLCFAHQMLLDVCIS